MGGNALKNTTTRRLGRADFDRVSHEVARGLAAAFPHARAAVIPAYASKSDFGDLDLLVTAEGIAAAGGRDALAVLARTTFHATELVRNTSVLSFDWRAAADSTEPGFQVDVIEMPELEFEFALGYFAYNDLGNLIGRTAHKFPAVEKCAPWVPVEGAGGGCHASHVNHGARVARNAGGGRHGW